MQRIDGSDRDILTSQRWRRIRFHNLNPNYKHPRGYYLSINNKTSLLVTFPCN